jgi:MFS family permease
VEKSNNHSAENGHCLPPDKDGKSMMTTTTKKDELRYGCFGFLPDRLQWLNNIRFAVLFISLAHCFQNTANGLLGVSLSTMEKRFDLSSSQSSWIASAYEIGQIPTIIVISYFGNRLHRPLSMALGLLSVSLGCIVFFIPQFSSPHYDPQSRETAEFDGLCRPFDSNSTTAASCDTQAGDKSQESLSYYLPMFIIGRMLIGIGATPIVSLGVTFMDDCCTKERFATYSGIYSAMSIVGPGIGILAGGLMLSVFVDFHVNNVL